MGVGWLALSTALAVSAAAPEDAPDETDEVTEPAKSATEQSQNGADGEGDDEGDDDFGEVGEVEDVHVDDSTVDVEVIEDEEPAAAIALGAYFHAASVHFPLGWLFLVVLFDGLALLLNREEMLKAGYYSLILTALSTLPSLTTGLMRGEFLATEPAIVNAAMLHRNLAFAFTVLIFATLGIRALAKNRLRGGVKIVYLAALAISLLLSIVVGHLGGEMIYGKPPF